NRVRRAATAKSRSVRLVRRLNRDRNSSEGSARPSAAQERHNSSQAWVGLRKSNFALISKRLSAARSIQSIKLVQATKIPEKDSIWVSISLTWLISQVRHAIRRSARKLS